MHLHVYGGPGPVSVISQLAYPCGYPWAIIFSRLVLMTVHKVGFYVYVFTCMCWCVCVCAYMCVCMYAGKVREGECTYVYTHTYIQYVHIHTCTRDVFVEICIPGKHTNIIIMLTVAHSLLPGKVNPLELC